MRWQVVLCQRAIALAVDKNSTALATEDGLIHLFNLKTGIRSGGAPHTSNLLLYWALTLSCCRITSPFTVGRHVVLLKLLDGCLMIISSNCKLNAW